MVADADFVPSETDVAVSVTVRLLGAAPGALYVIGAPLAVLVTDKVPHGGAEHDTVQMTP
jgi:hypothetical protein